MHIICSVYTHIINIRDSGLSKWICFSPGWSGSPMSRDLCRSSSSLRTRSRPTQSHRELSNKYPYWAVEWEGVHCNDSVLYLRGFSLFPQLMMGQSLKEA